jgi:oligopeptide transport system permease protein
VSVILCKRLLQSLVVIYAVATLVFVIMKAAPGGPFSEERRVSPVVEEQLREQYGLDGNAWDQYTRYLWHITPKRFDFRDLSRFDLKGGLGVDLGVSFRYEGRSVNDLIADALPVSMALGFFALLLSLGIGIPLGVISSRSEGSTLGWVLLGFSMIAIAVPSFVLGPMLQWIVGFGGLRGLELPILFWEDPFVDDWSSRMSHRLLPSIALSTFYVAGVMRLTRGSMRDVLRSDYLRTARAKGLPEWKVIWKHGLRGALTPVVSYSGPMAAHLLTGSFVVETLFAIPGMGMHLVNASLNRDYSLIMGTVLVYAVILVGFNLLMDLLVFAINPRYRYGNLGK